MYIFLLVLKILIDKKIVSIQYLMTLLPRDHGALRDDSGGKTQDHEQLMLLKNTLAPTLIIMGFNNVKNSEPHLEHGGMLETDAFSL